MLIASGMSTFTRQCNCVAVASAPAISIETSVMDAGGPSAINRADPIPVVSHARPRASCADTLPPERAMTATTSSVFITELSIKFSGITQSDMAHCHPLNSRRGNWLFRQSTHFGQARQNDFRSGTRLTSGEIAG